LPRPLAFLLSGYLLVWVPLGFAIELLSAFPSLARRGPLALAEVSSHGVAAALSAVAGWMGIVRSPAAGSTAAVAVVVNAAITVQSLFWTMLPRQVAPGERLPLTLLACAHAVFWLVMLHRWRRSSSG